MRYLEEAGEPLGGMVHSDRFVLNRNMLDATYPTSKRVECMDRIRFQVRHTCTFHESCSEQSR